MKITGCVRLLMLAVAAVLVCSSLAWAEKGGGKGIAFLTMLLAPDHVRLLDWTVVEGDLRPSRAKSAHGEWEYETTTASGEVIWKGNLSDPLRRRLEYEDPDHPGQIKAKFVTVDSARAVIRVPADSAASRIAVYRIERTTGADGKTVRVRRLIGSVDCPWREVQK
ncbi:MAG: hypothetical protein AB1792_00915 [Candidatus Zixiibacteriota bacterium]